MGSSTSVFLTRVTLNQEVFSLLRRCSRNRNTFQRFKYCLVEISFKILPQKLLEAIIQTEFVNSPTICSSLWSKWFKLSKTTQTYSKKFKHICSKSLVVGLKWQFFKNEPKCLQRWLRSSRKLLVSFWCFKAWMFERTWIHRMLLFAHRIFQKILRFFINEILRCYKPSFKVCNALFKF